MLFGVISLTVNDKKRLKRSASSAKHLPNWARKDFVPEYHWVNGSGRTAFADDMKITPPTRPDGPFGLLHIFG